MDELIAAWYAHQVKAARLALPTLATYRGRLVRFAAWLRDHKLDVIYVTPDDLHDWRDALQAHHAAATVNQSFAAVSNFYQWLKRNRIVASNPAADIRRLSRPARARRVRDALEDREVLAVLATCEDDRIGVRDRAILSLMAYCAMRTIECERGWTSDVEQEDERVILAVRRRSDDLAGDRIVLPPEAAEPLRAWLAEHPRPGGPLFVSLSVRTYGRRLSSGFMRRMIRARFRRAGVRGKTKTALSLRDSAVFAMIRSGATLADVQALTGCVDLATLMGYFRARPKRPKKARARISYDSGD